MYDTTSAIVINGKSYWPHVVELAVDIKKWRTEVKSKKESKDLEKLIKTVLTNVRSLRELLD